MNTSPLLSPRCRANFVAGPNGSPTLAGPVDTVVPRMRFCLPNYMLALLTGAALLAGQSARAANAPDNVVNGSTDLTLAGSYSAGLPGTTSDVTFTNVAYNPTAFTLNSSLSVGTLDDLDATQTLTVQNTAAGTTSVLTLNGGSNSVSGTAADLLFVAGGGTLSLGGGTGTGTLNLTLATAGNFNIVGTANISSAISATGLGIGKNGAGTLNLLGAGTSATGRLTENAGTINFGSATDAPTLTATDTSGSGVGIYVIGGNFNMVNGSLTSTSPQGLVLNGNNTYAQTGGTFSTNGRIELANGGGTSLVNISAGTLSTTLASGIETVRGTATINLSGTGALTTPIVDLSTTQLNSATGTASTTFNLNGGILTTGQIIPGTNFAGGAGGVFNFNGGTLTSSASSTAFMQGITSANVLAGGALINTGTFTDTINQNLLASATSTGGGLTKQGSGTLILGGTNTYTGANVIQAGTLGVTSDASLGAAPTTASSNIQFTGTTGTLQDTTNNVTLNANRGITVANAATATLDSTTNTFTVGGAVSISGAGATVTTLALTGTGAGTGDLAGTVSDAASTGGLAITKTGTGAWTVGGSGTSTLAKGSITESAGTLNFGSATETPSLTISALATPATANLTVSGGTFNLNAGALSLTQTTTGTVSLTGGSFNVSGGTLAVTTTAGGGVGITSTGGAISISGGATTVSAGQGLVLNGSAAATYTQTGGTFSTNGFIEFANNGGTSTVNISGGSLTTTNAISTTDAFDMAVRGTSTLNLSGTGAVTTPVLNLTTSQISGGAAGGTFNLNGGTLTTGRIIPGTNGTTGSGTFFNFNGGTLKVSAASTTFLQGITAANVQAGGAAINTNGFNVTIGQSLVTGTAAGTPDGGLTKTGTGILTLAGSNTYTGPTTLSVGALTLSTSTALSDTALLSIANGTTFNLSAASGTSEIVGSLILGGTAIAPNTYTAAQLAGLDSNITFTSSAGETLTVAAAVPEPSTWAAGLACLGLMGFKLRRRWFARL